MSEIVMADGRASIIDEVDCEYLLRWKWRINEQGYVVRTRGVEDGPGAHVISMARVILARDLDRPIVDGLRADHVDMNILDNRRSNLREATRSQNKANRTKPKGETTSKYKGVRLVKKAYNLSRPWEANIMVQQKQIYLGMFETETEAAIAYNKAAVLHFGEFARINEIAK